MKNTSGPTLITSPEYRQFIEDMKAWVISARISAARSVNRDLILLYWDIGRGIVEKQKTLGWGESVVETVAMDLHQAFPATTGFSPRNLWDMRRLEDRLVSRLQAFLLELGYGFCFVGRQHRLTLGQKEYFIDLLFYHRFLKALVAFELKVGPFEPEHAGKMDFYLNLLNDKERGPDDQPSIGIILCAEKDDVEVEYALRTKANPIGVATYQLQSKLPADLKGKLPTAKQLADVVRTVLPIC